MGRNEEAGLLEVVAKRVTCMTRDIPRARWLEVRSRWYPSGLRRLIEALRRLTV